MTRQREIIDTIKVLRKEIEVLTKRVKPNATGHIITAIGVINGRIDELIQEAMGPFFENEDVYDGYEQHTEAMEQARLRKIQDSAAGRSNDDVEHTKEYYDTERNRAPNNEVWGGLSNRSMKQNHGQAVQTTSEMMQEELEPLPINTFK